MLVIAGSVTAEGGPRRDPVVLRLAGRRVVVVLTEWDEFSTLDFDRVFRGMKKPAFAFDGRNILPHERLRAIGFEVSAIGKPQRRN